MSDAFETEDVQEQFVAGAMVTGHPYNRDEAREWFAEWLAKVKAEAQVEALREVAQDAEWSDVALPGMTAKDVIRGVRARADRIAREAGIETGEKNDD